MYSTMILLKLLIRSHMLAAGQIKKLQNYGIKGNIVNKSSSTEKTKSKGK